MLRDLAIALASVGIAITALVIIGIIVASIVIRIEERNGVWQTDSEVTLDGKQPVKILSIESSYDER